MVCKHCGNSIGSDLSVCPFCGEKTGFIFMKKESSEADNYDNTNGSSIIRTFTLIAGIMCVVGLFMPLIEINIMGTSSGMSFRDASSKDFSILFIAGIVGIIAGIFKQYVFAAIAGGIYCYFFYIDTKDLNTILGLGNSEYIYRGIGYFCMLIGCAALLIFSVCGCISKLKEKQ